MTIASVSQQIFTTVRDTTVNTVRKFVDVDSLLKNEELQLWYERFRVSGVVLLLLNLTYVGLYIGYRIVADFTVSSFLFGYAVSMLCSISSHVFRFVESRQDLFRSILNNNSHLLNSAINGAIGMVFNYKMGHIASEPPVSHVQSVDLRQSVIETSSCDSDEDDTADKDDRVTNSACIQLGGTIDTSTKVSLDSSILEYIIQKREHDAEYLRRLGVAEQHIDAIAPASSPSMSETPAEPKIYDDENMSDISDDIGLSDIDTDDESDEGENFPKEETKHDNVNDRE
jgi:hypothetical protein